MENLIIVAKFILKKNDDIILFHKHSEYLRYTQEIEILYFKNLLIKKEITFSNSKSVIAYIPIIDDLIFFVEHNGFTRNEILNSKKETREKILFILSIISCMISIISIIMSIRNLK